MFKLVIQDDEGKTTVVPLIRDEITIGRKEGNTIRLTERNVSRRHARILRNNGEVQIEDLGSYNGIRVNNARIAERVSLRVSDQAQIGDYKLYLKAEGVEQVDDARTMPIERIDALTPTGGSTTDVIPVAAPPVMATGTQPPTAPQLVGNPNRTMVATADTDPGGRPVATAAAVAALTAPVGYGKLVVLSSNFAGKEFELSRPQMIIGRTDENDIVINHRSISRNHAKLVREPESGRYTISDLQSSNGVRVNGQDYGKVELRRGDVVDLGHVRLRFVEPGEDFVFARDAVITDVPDVGGKKGLLVAVLLGVLVLGGIGAFFALKGGDKPKGSEIVTPGSGTGSTNEDGSGSDTQVAVTPPPSIDAAVVAEITPDAAVTNAHPGDDIKIECLTLSTAKEWAKMAECADRLGATDPTTAKTLRTKAAAENKADSATRNMEDAIKAKDFKKAQAELDKIPSDSVYRNDAQNAFKTASRDLIDDYRDRAQSLADAKKCDEMRRLIREADNKGVGEEAHKVTCKPEVVADNPPPPKLDCNKTPNDARCPKQGSNTKPPDKDCDADALKAKGDEYLQNGMDAAALAAFEASMRCKSDSGLLRMAYMAACRSKSWQKAKYYYSKVPASQTTNITQICIRYGFDPTKP